MKRKAQKKRARFCMEFVREIEWEVLNKLKKKTRKNVNLKYT